MKIYEVGGSVRDFVLGLPVKDKDYCVIASSYQEMKEYILDSKGEIYLERPEYFAIRCRMPDLGPVDFVLGRKDGSYSDSRRPDSVEICSNIEEELARRDFGMNAMAIDISDKNKIIIDPFGGKDDICHKLILMVGDPYIRLKEDGLRILRAIRFSVTLNFSLSISLQYYLKKKEIVDLLDKVSKERIREELNKMFSFDTLKTLDVLNNFNLIKEKCFAGQKLWLKPTLEKRIDNK